MKKVLIAIAVLVVAVLFSTAWAQEDLLTGDYSASGWAIAYPEFRVSETCLTVTNGQAIGLLGGGRYRLLASGQTSGYTNTITISTPYRKAGLVVLYVDPASSNLVTIADSTSVVALGSNLVLGPSDTAVLDIVRTNELNKLSTANN